jgi:anti-sigma28 factor (negative regulator of flagellin synthesis)
MGHRMDSKTQAMQQYEESERSFKENMKAIENALRSARNTAGSGIVVADQSVPIYENCRAVNEPTVQQLEEKIKELQRTIEKGGC